jgi:hypothetical protein
MFMHALRLWGISFHDANVPPIVVVTGEFMAGARNWGIAKPGGGMIAVPGTDEGKRPEWACVVDIPTGAAVCRPGTACIDCRGIVGITVGSVWMLGISDGVATGDPNFDNPGGGKENNKEFPYTFTDIIKIKRDGKVITNYLFQGTTTRSSASRIPPVRDARALTELTVDYVSIQFSHSGYTTVNTSSDKFAAKLKNYRQTLNLIFGSGLSPTSNVIIRVKPLLSECGL